jgi:hypothetical protein
MSSEALAKEDCASIRAASDGRPLPREANNLYVIFSGRAVDDSFHHV